MNRALRVLHVEDSQRDADLLRRHLTRAGYQITSDRVETPGAMRALLTAEAWDVILCDYSMPQFNALQALALLQKMALDIPFIIISGTVGEAVAVEAMRAGAHDYLMKDSLTRLAPTIERELLEAENRRARRQVEAALRASEDRYRDLVEHSHDLICTHDLEGRLLTVNQAAAKIMGGDIQSLLGRNIREALLPKYRAGFDDYIAELLREGMAQGVMYVRTCSGEKRIWEYTNTLRTAGVAVPVVRGLARDVTERKQAEAALKASEAELRALFAAMTDVILVLDAQGRHLKIAPTDPTYLYKPPDEMIGRSLDQIFPKKVAGFFLDHIRLALNEGQMRRIEYRLQFDDKEMWFDTSISPMSKDSVLWIARDITKRKQAEERVRLQATALESAANAIVISDRQGVITWANPAFTELTGYALEEVLGKHPSLFKSGKHDSAFYDALWQTILSGQVWRGDLTNRRKDGSLYIEEMTITPVMDEAGEIINFIAIKQDITERKRTEEALRESERHYRFLFESNPHPMWTYDLETLGFLAVNESALQHYGYSREDFLAMTIKDIRPPEDIPVLIINLSQVTSGLDRAGIWRHRKKNGEIIDVEITSHTLTFAGRRAEVVLANDVTERKRAEEQLRHQLNYTAAITKSLGEGVYALDRRGRVTFMNPAAEAALGYSQAELSGQPMHEAIHFQYADGTPRPPDECPLVGALESGEIVEVEDDVFTRKDGSLFHVSYTSSPIITAGQVVGDVLAFRDISERRTLEEQLRQSQKMEAIGQLAGGIAHDFNNLLTAIIGYSDLSLMPLKAGDPLRHYVGEIKKAGERAAELTRQLLAFSRKQVLQPKVLDLNTVVADLEKMLQRLIGEDIKLRTVLDPELGNIKADPGQIEQVIMNLAVNARDAMPTGGKLTIETSNVYFDEEYSTLHIGVTPGAYIMLAVSDTGTGMDAATQARIFEPFFTTKEVGKGTGLGLSTVYGIVKQSGGNIWVYSEPGWGTTFKVYLTRVGEDAQRYKQNGAPEKVFRGTETILLAEDEDVVRKLARQVLEMYGYRVLEANNGGGALLICERYEEPIDLLITDVVMPEMSGRTLSDRLSQIRPEMRVLYMSGYTDNAIIHKGVLDEAANFIQKPFAPDVLARKIREVLDATINA
jgi:two-component system, cell cycle sensor histidine kinase and response regulator CckA